MSGTSRPASAPLVPLRPRRHAQVPPAPASGIMYPTDRVPNRTTFEISARRHARAKSVKHSLRSAEGSQSAKGSHGG